jgi:methionyl-tRNA formyltransferase
MKRITLFINGDLGLHVIDTIRLNPDFVINAVILNDVSKCSKEYALRIENHEYIKELCVPVLNYSQDLLKDSNFQSALEDTTFGISALFGHVLESEFLEEIGFKIYNLHPSLLPYSRGADPVAWGIIQNGPQGGTIHEIDAGIDTGLIISQQQLKTDISMTAGEIYRLTIESLKVQLSQFLLRWPNLANYPITNTKSSYNKTADLAHVRNSLIEDSSEIEKVIRIIQALTFSDGRIPILRFSDGELWTVNIKCARLEGNIKS